MAAKAKTTKDSSGAEQVPASNIRVNGGDIISAARGFDGDSFEKGYPGIANEDMHNNQGRGGARMRGK